MDHLDLVDQPHFSKWKIVIFAVQSILDRLDYVDLVRTSCVRMAGSGVPGCSLSGFPPHLPNVPVARRINGPGERGQVAAVEC